MSPPALRLRRADEARTCADGDGSTAPAEHRAWARRAHLRHKVRDARHYLPTLLAGKGLIGRFAYLVATQVVTVLLGLVYWTTVARLVVPGQVGLASTAMFAASLIAALGVLGLTSLVLVVLGPADAGERRAIVSTSVTLSAILTGAIALGVWGASRFMGPSFRRVGADPVTALLFVLGTSTFTAVTVLDAVCIGLRRGPVQLARNIVSAGLKVALAGACVLLGFRTTTGLLGAWDASMLISVPIVPLMLRLHRHAPAYSLRQRVALVRRFGMLSLRHHLLNVAISSVAFFLPVVAALFTVPEQMAYFSMAQLVSASALLLPFLLTMSLFVESSGDHELLRRNLRRTLPVGLGCCLLVLGVLEPGGPLVLSVFGHNYVTHGLIPLRLLLLGGLPYVAKDHFVAVRRAQERLGEAAKIGAISTLAEIAAAALGGWLGGLNGLCFGWLCCTVLEATYFLPRVLAVLRSSAPTPTLGTELALETVALSEPSALR